MCEIFPEVENCCGVISVRVGMMLIAILSITTGALSLAVIEQKSNFNLDQAFLVYQNASNYTSPREVVRDLGNLIYLIVTFMAFVFMFAGLSLLFSTLSDQEGFAQIFVWMVFFNIFIGILTVLAVSFECSYGTKCLLEGMDGLSLATFMVGLVAYLMVWYYFCCVANSYVLNAYS